MTIKTVVIIVKEVRKNIAIRSVSKNITYKGGQIK